jgi:hypothetical protein
MNGAPNFVVVQEEQMATAKANTGVLRVALRAQAQEDGERQTTVRARATAKATTNAGVSPLRITMEP